MAMGPLLVVSTTSCGCDSGEETQLVTRRGDRYYACDPDVGVGDSIPPSCGAPRGSAGNPRIAGPAVRELAAIVDDHWTAYIRLTRDCDGVVAVRLVEQR